MCLSLNEAIAPSRAPVRIVNAISARSRRSISVVAGIDPDDVPDLLQGRNPCRAPRLRDPRLFSRKIEVLGIRIGNPRFVAGLPGKPDEKPLKGRQRGVERSLAQRLATPAATLIGQAALEGLGLLDMKRLEIRHLV